MTRLAPNPRSPFATADPQFRHFFPRFMYFPEPPRGVLALTACTELAVVVGEPADIDLAAPPDGVCPSCVSAALRDTLPIGEPAPVREVRPCRECELATEHGYLCTLCRQDAHRIWMLLRPPEDLPVI